MGWRKSNQGRDRDAHMEKVSLSMKTRLISLVLDAFSESQPSRE